MHRIFWIRRAAARDGHGQVSDHMFLDGLEDAYDGRLMVPSQRIARSTTNSHASPDEFAIRSLTRAQCN